MAAAAATILTVAIIATSNMMMTAPSAATTTTEAETTTPASLSGVELSPQPIYQERSPSGNITRINQTHAISIFSGNGMLTLPNTTQTINTTHNGTALISSTTSSGYAKETIRTENGETATATVYEIVQLNPAAPGEGKGIVIAVFHTNSTGRLAPLNGLILTGIDEFYVNPALINSADISLLRSCSFSICFKFGPNILNIFCCIFCKLAIMVSSSFSSSSCYCAFSSESSFFTFSDSHTVST